MTSASNAPDQDLYDVPRSAKPIAVETSQNNISSSYSRPQSSLSGSSSGVGCSVRDSKDSLDDCLYDVPRSASNSYANLMETKYDTVGRSSLTSSSSGTVITNYNDDTLTRNMAAISISDCSVNSDSTPSKGEIRALSYNGSKRGPSSVKSEGNCAESRIRKDSHREFCSPNMAKNNSVEIQNLEDDDFDLYDVPRGSSNHKDRKRMVSSTGNILNTVGGSSLSVAATNHELEDYDVPRSVHRNPVVSGAKSVANIAFSRTSSEDDRFSCASESEWAQKNLNVRSNRSMGSLPRIPSYFRKSGEFNWGDGRFSVNGSGNSLDNITKEAQIKLLPLGPKAAVSVCEKLTKEVTASVANILEFVHPKWRTKENLTKIMANLKFNCTRLSLAVKVG